MTISPRSADFDIRSLIKSSNGSLWAKHLSDNLLAVGILCRRTVRSQFGLFDLISTGLSIPESTVGIYMPDEESYRVFYDYLVRIIWDLHRVESFSVYMSEFTKSKDHHFDFPDYIDQFPTSLPVSFQSNRIRTTRIRVARNIRNFTINPVEYLPFPPKLTLEQRLLIQSGMIDIFNLFPNDLQGQYIKVSDMTPDEQDRLRKEFLLFQAPDRYLLQSGISDDYPEGRGIFIHQSRTLLIWVGEEDHLRIISFINRFDPNYCLNLINRTLNHLEKYLIFAYHPKLGYLTSCPSNVGTGLRIGCHVEVGSLSKHDKTTLSRLYLQARGTNGEHSEAIEGIYDISSSIRFGPTVSVILETFMNSLFTFYTLLCDIRELASLNYE